jgi:hypothetical protein
MVADKLKPHFFSRVFAQAEQGLINACAWGLSEQAAFEKMGGFGRRINFGEYDND